VAKAAPSEIAPVTLKPSPKKETARIQIPQQPKDLPKATVKLQQTQPLSTAPGSNTRPLVQNVKTNTESADSLVQPLSIAAFAFSLVAFLIQLWIFL